MAGDLPADAGLARSRGRAHAETRFEDKGLAFHERLRGAFLAIADAEPARCAVIDATRSKDEVAGAAWAAVTARLGVR